MFYEFIAFSYMFQLFTVSHLHAESRKACIYIAMP